MVTSVDENKIKTQKYKVGNKLRKEMDVDFDLQEPDWKWSKKKPRTNLTNFIGAF